MITRAHLARSTVPAIAAALVLGSTPLLAQQQPAVQPSAVPAPAPVPSAAAPAPQPTPRLQMPVAPTTAPAPQTAPPVSSSTAPATPGATPGATPNSQAPTRVFNAQPVVQAVPPSTEAAPAPAAEAASPAARAPAASAAPSPRAAVPAARTTAATPPPPEPAIPEQIPEAAPPGDIPPPLPPVPPVIDGSVDAVPGAEPVSQTASTDTAVWMGLLASALGVLGLGFLGALALRRRQVRRVDEVPQITRPNVTAKKPDPVTTSPIVTHDLGSRPAMAVPTGVVTTASLAAAQPRLDEAPRTEPRPEPRTQQPVSPIREQVREASLAPAGASVPLPRKVPESSEEREALLDRMVAAKPDRANPFTTPRARRRRARLILQSLGRKFDSGKSRIDFSQYPQNWPELQGNNSVAA